MHFKVVLQALRCHDVYSGIQFPVSDSGSGLRLPSPGRVVPARLRFRLPASGSGGSGLRLPFRVMSCCTWVLLSYAVVTNRNFDPTVDFGYSMDVFFGFSDL